MYTIQHLNHVAAMTANAEDAAREAQTQLAGWQNMLAHIKQAMGMPDNATLPPCTCQLPGTPGVQHRYDGTPCYQVPDSGIHARRDPYAAPTLQVPPPGPTPFEQQPGLTPTQQQAHTAFEEFHGDVCKDDGGPRKADTCVLLLDSTGVHGGRHDDGNGHTWAAIWPDPTGSA